MGSFNPMIDLYEFKSEKFEFIPNEQYIGENPLEVSVKFVHFHNKPPYGTKEYFKLNNNYQRVA